jgi:PAS domain S-box-containing protein
VPRTPLSPDSPPNGHSSKLIRILTIVFLYALFASLWILLSDKAVEWLFKEPGKLALAGTLKGFAFVAVTSLLLYAMMRRLLDVGRPAADLLPGRWPLLRSIGALAVVIVGITAAAIYHSVIQHRETAAAQLQAIVDLKSRQIEDWLSERYGDARFIQSSRFWAELYRRWFEANDETSWRTLRERMDEFRKLKAFQGILLLDEQGGLLWDSQNGVHDPDSAIRAALARQAAADRQITHLGPYRDAKGALHLDFVIPMAHMNNQPAPIVVLHVDPAEQLFDRLQNWPGSSPSGETLLFRRAGEHVLYLSGLRHQFDAPGTIQRPMRLKNLLAVQILENETARNHPVEGIDYRGVEVFGIGRQIRGTDWYLVAKLDQAELVANAMKDIVWIACAGLLALFFTTAGTVLLRQRQALAAALRESAAKEEKLRALQLLEAIAEASKDAIFAKDAQGRYLLFNREAARLVGQPKDAVLGRDDTALFPLAEAREIMANDRRVMAEKRTITFHENITTSDGRIDLMATKGPLLDAEGNIVGTFGVSRDITELKRTEAILRETSERLRLFIEHAPVALAMFDRQMRYLSASRRWLGDYHLGHRDLTGLCHYDVFPEIAEGWKAVHRRALAGEVVGNDRDRFERADGTVQWERWEVRPWYDAAGAVAGIVIFSEDITARIQAERELADREKYLRTILQTTADGFWMSDADGTILDVNEAYCRMIGYTRDELIGLSIAAVEANETPQEVIGHIARVAARGTDLFETRHRTKDGRMIDVEVSVTAMEGEAVRMICLCRDITERKRAAAETATLQARIQQAQKMESIGNLAGGIAHDFNNILFPIIGFSEMLLDDLGADPPQAESLREIIAAAKRGSELVRQILTFSRQTEHKKIPVRVQQVLKEVLRLTRATIPADIHISQEIQADCPLVMADPTQLHQIAMNLITNAYHAVEHNRGTIDVSLKEVELGAGELAHDLVAPGRYVVLSVSDTGCGIDPANMQKIFEPYFTTKEKGKGTGLGLSVVYGIVREHKGDIKVANEPGKGTTFRVFLPLMERLAEDTPAEAGEALPTGSEKILLVDDEEAVMRMERQILQRLGYRVDAYISSVAALEAFRADPGAFDMLLTDMAMPNLTGDLLAKAVREIRPDLPVVICTGFSERINPEKAAAIGIGGFLMKPLVRADLARTLREVLDRARGRNGR